MARVLIVDDNINLLSEIGAGLRRAGHLVTSTNNGSDAVCLLSNVKPDVLVLDLNIPGIDGHQVLKQLGPTAPPVVVISGDFLREDELSIPALTRVLTKPFTLTQLIEAIGSCLNKENML